MEMIRPQIINLIKTKYIDFVYNDTVQVGWFLYVCLLIMETYGINIFEGDGSDFDLAYFCRGACNGMLDIVKKDKI